MRKQYAVLLLLCMVFLLMAGGCGHTESQPDTTEQDVQSTVQEEEGVYITLYAPGETEEPESENTAVPGEVETLDDLTTTLVTIVPEDELNAETIVAQYNQLVVTGLYGEELAVNTVKQEGSQVWVDFDSAQVQAIPFEEGTEGVLFYHLARSITDNLGDVDSVYLTMDGGNDFKLAHLWFEASRPFYTGTMPVEGE